MADVINHKGLRFTSSKTVYLMPDIWVRENRPDMS